MKQMITSICCLVGLMYSFVGDSYAQTLPNEIIQGPFRTNLYPEGKIYFEKENDATPDDSCQTIAFILEYKQANQLKKEKVDEYYGNGGCVKLASVFFAKVHNKNYIFVMQKWEHHLSGVGIDNDEYETSAYTKNKKGKLIIDADLSADPNFSGIDGIVDDDVHHRRCYKYKTAAEVKKYLKQKYQ
ncbi:hypothetical protein [Commensalibacter communis]|uniref:hypothetical protein n=1 Tax=Commensalibacter communis TaxID=2972786 RepID=UPI0022FF663F|nr:hypothetical protein [Commensalibacter communis]CAI3937689.1 unnamed protein product [Commensalibacter communis]CAI3940546.1 unnamed protein product [Commensalibacter communis]